MTGHVIIDSFAVAFRVRLLKRKSSDPVLLNLHITCDRCFDAKKALFETLTKEVADFISKESPFQYLNDDVDYSAYYTDLDIPDFDDDDFVGCQTGLVSTLDIRAAYSAQEANCAA